MIFCFHIFVFSYRCISYFYFCNFSYCFPKFFYTRTTPLKKFQSELPLIPLICQQVPTQINTSEYVQCPLIYIVVPKFVQHTLRKELPAHFTTLS
jgi:hypothetical protein